MLRDRLRLVESLQSAVVALVQAPATFDRGPHAIGGIENKPQRADCALQYRRKGNVRFELFGLQLAPCLNRLQASLIAQIDVVPACKKILDVPSTLAVANQDQFSGHFSS